MSSASALHLFKLFTERTEGLTEAPIAPDVFQQLISFTSFAADELESLFEGTDTTVRPTVRLLRLIYAETKTAVTNQLSYVSEQQQTWETEQVALRDRISDLEMKTMEESDKVRGLQAELQAHETGRQISSIQNGLKERKVWDRERDMLLRQVSALEISLDDEREKNKELMMRLGDMVERQTMDRVKTQQEESALMEARAREIREREARDRRERSKTPNYRHVTPRRRSMMTPRSGAGSARRGESPDGSPRRSSFIMQINLSDDAKKGKGRKRAHTHSRAGSDETVLDVMSDADTDAIPEGTEDTDEDYDDMDDSGAEAKGSESDFDERELALDDGRLFELKMAVSPRKFVPRLDSVMPGELTSRRVFSERENSINNPFKVNDMGIDLPTQLAGFSSPIHSSRKHRRRNSDASEMTVMSEVSDDSISSLDPGSAPPTPGSGKRKGGMKSGRGTARGRRTAEPAPKTKKEKPDKAAAMAKSLDIPPTARILQPVKYIVRAPKVAIHTVADVMAFIDGVFIKLQSDMEARTAISGIWAGLGSMTVYDACTPIPHIAFPEFVYSILFRNTGSKTAADKELVNLLLSLAEAKKSDIGEACAAVSDQLSLFHGFLVEHATHNPLVLEMISHAISLALYSMVGSIRDVSLPKLAGTMPKDKEKVPSMLIPCVDGVRARHIIDNVFENRTTADEVAGIIADSYVSVQPVADDEESYGEEIARLHRFVPLWTLLEACRKGVIQVSLGNSSRFKKKLTDGTQRLYKDLAKLAKTKGEKPPSKASFKGCHFTPLLTTLQAVHHTVSQQRVMDAYIDSCFKSGAASVPVQTVEAVLSDIPHQLFTPRVEHPWAEQIAADHGLLQQRIPEITAHVSRVTRMLAVPDITPNLALRGSLYTELATQRALRFAPFGPLRTALKAYLEEATKELIDSANGPDVTRTVALFRTLCAVLRQVLIRRETLCGAAPIDLQTEVDGELQLLDAIQGEIDDETTDGSESVLQISLDSLGEG